MSKKKTDFAERLIAEVQPRFPLPKAPMAGATLLEQGAYVVLMRHLTEAQAEASVQALRDGFEDWNEVRVSQPQEIAQYIKSGSRKKGTELLNELKPVAMLIRDYLQDVFQETHHLDLEELRGEEGEAGQVITELGVLGMSGAGYVMWVALDGKLPIHLPLVRMLDRLGLIAKATTLKKARELIEPLVPKGKELEFTVAMHEVIARWEDPDAPIYETVEVLQSTPFGKKALKERQVAAAKAEAQQKRDDERQRKEDERLKREAEREAKRQAFEAQKRAREDEKKRLKEAEIQAKKAEAERKVLEQKKAAEAKKQAAEREKVAAKKAKEAAVKKAAAEKVAAKVAAQKKAAADKAAAQKRAAADKAAAQKKAAAERERAAAKKKADADKAKTSKKPTATKSAAKKTVSKKPTSKRPASNRSTSKKPTPSKKPTAKRNVAKA